MASLFSGSYNSKAQDFKDALLKMKSAYGNAERIHIMMSIQAFEKESSSKPFYIQKVEIKKDHKNFLYELGNRDMLLNATYLIMTDHTTKQIFFNKPDSSAATGLQDPFKVNIDSLLTAYGKSSYMGTTNELEYYKIIHAKGMVKQTDMYFLVQTKLLQKIEYHYRANQRVTIDFKVFDKEPQFAADTFDEAKYIAWLDGKPRAGQSYLGYRVINAKESTKVIDNN